MLRDEASMCPVCEGRALDARGQRLVCTGCEGSLVPESELRALIAEAKKQGVVNAGDGEYVLTGAISAEPGRTCPRCLTAMTKHDLYGMTVDRCEAHGIWFDGEELGRVLNDVGLASARKAAKLSIPHKVMTGIAIAGYIAMNVVRFIYY